MTIKWKFILNKLLVFIYLFIFVCVCGETLEIIQGNCDDQVDVVDQAVSKYEEPNIILEKLSQV